MKRYIENGINVLEADEGKYLLSGDNISELVYLGKEDDGNSWIELDKPMNLFNDIEDE